MTSSITSRLATNPSQGVKSPCVVATTANITLTAAQTIDGIAVVAGDRVFVKDQTTAAEDGIYVCKDTAWVRATDWNEAEDVSSGVIIPVASGAAGQGLHQVTFSGTFAVGTTTLTTVYVDLIIDDPGILLDADFTAKGQILVGTGSGTWVALPVGTNDFTLTADSAEASGVKWVATESGITMGKAIAASIVFG